MAELAAEQVVDVFREEAAHALKTVGIQGAFARIACAIPRGEATAYDELLDDGLMNGVRLGGVDVALDVAIPADKDAARAYRAVFTLAADGKAAAFLQERLIPATDKDSEPTRKLIADLDSNQFEVREKASRDLERLEDRVVPALRAVLKGKPDLEVQRRIERILKRIDRPVPPKELLTSLRALEVLEYSGTAE